MDKREKAIFTYIKNGHKHFRLWYDYYSKIFDPQDIYVLDLGSTDGCTDGLDLQIVNHTIEPRIDYGNQLINDFKTELLQKYKWVVYTDYDEILWHPLGLGNLISSLKDEPYMTAMGYEVIQKRKEEAPFDFNKTILSQRKYWYRNANYDKSLITQVNFKWDSGFHTIENKPPRYYNYKLILLHFSKLDFDYVNALHHKLKAEQSPLAGGIFEVNEELAKIWFFLELKAEKIPEYYTKLNFV